MANIQYYEHLCACGCGGQIEIKKYHKWYGIPLVTNGHQQKNKISHRKGRKLSEKHINNIKKAVQGENNPFYGKQHTDESKIKQAKAKIGKASNRKGKKESEEIRKNKSIFMMGRFIGEKAFNWQGGKSFEIYPKEFKNIRIFILERDNYKCQNPNCIIENPKRLDCHHIDYDKNNNNPENLTTLCKNCHAKTIGKKSRSYWIEFYQNIMIDRIVECLL